MKRHVLLPTVLLVVAAAGALILALRIGDVPSQTATATPESHRVTSGGTSPGETLLTPSTDSTANDASRAPPPSAQHESSAKPTPDEAPAFVTIRITALGTGRAIAGVHVSLHERESSGASFRFPHTNVGRAVYDSLESDAEGLVHFEVAPHTEWVAWASGAWGKDEIPPGRAHTDVRALEPGEQIEIQLALPTESDVTFVGQLVSAEDDSPIAFGRVYLVFDYTKFAVDPASGQPPAIPREAVHGELERDNRRHQIAAPDPAGFFEIGSASWVHASVRVDVPGRSLIQVPIESGHSSAESALKIRVTRTARVVAAVVDAAGRPRDRVQVTIAPRGLPTLRLVGSVANRHEAVWRASTDSVGACTIDDLPANVPLEVELTSGLQVDRRTDDALVLNPGEERRLVLVFGGSSTVRGHLIDHADAPIANELVWIRRADKRPRAWFAPDEKVFAEARTDAEGRFSFDRVSAGDWWVGPAAREMRIPSREIARALAPVVENVRVPQSGVVEVIVRSDRGLSIRGRVVGPKGEPMPDVAVSARVDARWSAEAASNGDGSFVVGPLVDGEYELTASPSRLHFRSGDEERPDASLAKSAPLQARAGAQGVELTLRLGGVLRWTTDSEDAQLVDGLEVRVMDANGQAVFEPMSSKACVLAPGTYSVFLSSSHTGKCGGADGIEVRAGGTTDVVIELRGGAKLRVRSDASASGSVEYQLYRDGRCLAFRHAVDTGIDHVVPPGRVLVRTRSGTDAWSEQSVDVAAGETRELVLGPK